MNVLGVRKDVIHTADIFEFWKVVTLRYVLFSLTHIQALGCGNERR